MASKVKVEFKPNKARIETKIRAGSQAMTIAVTEAVIEYGNLYVRFDQGELRDSALKKSVPKKGLAIWEKGNFAKKLYYTGTPSKDKNPQASLMWAEKGVKTHKKELDQVAKNAFTKGFGK